MKRTYIRPAVSTMHLTDRQPLLADSTGYGQNQNNKGEDPSEGKSNPFSDEEGADPWQTEYNLWK